MRKKREMRDYWRKNSGANKEIIIQKIENAPLNFSSLISLSSGKSFGNLSSRLVPIKIEEKEDKKHETEKKE